MSKPNKAVMEFMAKYGVASDEIWPVPGGKAYAVMHKALERIAVEKGIVFDRPSVVACDLANKSMVICTFATMGDKTEWSFGEASPANNRNQYMAAMAEKRSRDRVILKLLAAHGDIYSEAEADDFKQPRHSTPDGFDDAEPIPAEHVITRDDGIQVLTMDAQRPIFAELERELLDRKTVEDCKRWKVQARSRASRLSGHWKDELNKRYLEHLRSLEKLDADEYQERMTG